MKRLDVRAAARRLSVCAETVRRWIRSGVLPATRVARYRYQIDPEQLDAIFSHLSASVLTGPRPE